MRQRTVLLGLIALALLGVAGSLAVRLRQQEVVIRTIPLGSTPLGLAVDAATGRAFVVSNTDGTVAVIDVKAGRLLRTVLVGDGPTGVAVDERDGRVVVSNTNTDVTQQTGQFFLLRSQWSGLSSLSLLDARTGRLVRSIPASASLAGSVADARQRRLLVATDDDPQPGVGSINILRGSGEGQRLATVPGMLLALALDSRANRLLVASDAQGGTVSVLDAAHGRLVSRSGIGPVLLGQSLAVDEQTGRAFALTANLGSNTGSICVFDTRTGRLLRSIALSSVPAAVAVDQATGHVFISAIGPAAPINILPGYRPWYRHLVVPLSTGNGSVLMLDARSGTIVHTASVGVAPGAVAVDAAHHHVLVATVGAMDGTGAPRGPGSVAVLDARSGVVLRTIPVGVAPGAIAVDARAARAIVLNLGGAVHAPDTWGWMPDWLRQHLPLGAAQEPANRIVPGSATVVNTAT